MKRVHYDGTRRIITAFQEHEESLYVQQDSTEFEKHLAKQNAGLRNLDQTGQGPVRLHLQMSEQDYNQLLLKYPLLATGNTEQRRTLWQQIAKQRPDLVAMEFKPRLHAIARGIQNAG